MPKYEYLNVNNNKIAYRYYKRSKKTVIFIHGLKSDMNGIKNQFISINIVEIKIIHICALILEGMENQVERLLITV